MKKIQLYISLILLLLISSCSSRQGIEVLLKENLKSVYSPTHRYVWISNLDIDSITVLTKDIELDGYKIKRDQGFWLLYDFSRKKLIKIIETSIAIGGPEWTTEESFFIYNGNAGSVRDLWICDLNNLINWSTTIFAGDIKDYFYFPQYHTFVWYYIANDFKPESDAQENNTLGIQAVDSKGEIIWNITSSDKKTGFSIEEELSDGVIVSQFNGQTGERNKFEKKVH